MEPSEAKRKRFSRLSEEEIQNLIEVNVRFSFRIKPRCQGLTRIFNKSSFAIANGRPCWFPFYKMDIPLSLAMKNMQMNTTVKILKIQEKQLRTLLLHSWHTGQQQQQSFIRLQVGNR